VFRPKDFIGAGFDREKGRHVHCELPSLSKGSNELYHSVFIVFYLHKGKVRLVLPDGSVFNLRGAGINHLCS
jgi:hypothetical protein